MITDHEPVMTAALLGHLAPGQGGLFVDCTVGLGGHAQALLAGGASRVLCLDRDKESLGLAAQALSCWGDRVEFVHADYRQLNDVLESRGILTIDGALADLGVSSYQLASEGRGFSFRQDGPLDMRMDRSTGPTAEDLVREASEKELADIIFNYGEERHSRRIARAIIAQRYVEPISTTGQLAKIIRRTLPRRINQRIDPATRTFQAIRIWVNQELEGLDTFLQDVSRRLSVGAHLAVITFHSLEDRIVKSTFRAIERGGEIALKVITKKPERPDSIEISKNPRSRSSKLRVAKKLL